MSRRLFTGTSVLSLLVCLAAASVWVRTSYGRPISWWFVDNPHNEGNLSVRRGSLSMDYVLIMEMTLFQNPPSAQLLADGFVKCGFSVERTPWRGRKTAAYRAVIPMWAILAAFGLLPAAWTIRRLTSRRLAGPGACTICGYDLRASKDRCSECGTIIPVMMKP